MSSNCFSSVECLYTVNRSTNLSVLVFHKGQCHTPLDSHFCHQVANAQLDALRLENRHLRQASLHMDGWDAAHAHKQLQCLETAYSSSLSALQVCGCFSVKCFLRFGDNQSYTCARSSNTAHLTFLSLLNFATHLACACVMFLPSLFTQYVPSSSPCHDFTSARESEASCRSGRVETTASRRTVSSGAAPRTSAGSEQRVQQQRWRNCSEGSVPANTRCERVSDSHKCETFRFFFGARNARQHAQWYASVGGGGGE